MIDHPYLIALALIEQEGKRGIPLGGKSLISPIDANGDPGETGIKLAQQILLRVLQKSDSNPIRRAAGDKSILIIQISMNLMQERIPLIKSNWINSGNTTKLIEDLANICEGVWSISFSRDKGIHFFNLS